MANAATAEAPESLRSGDMMKLMFHSAPVAASESSFTAEDGTDRTLAAYHGKVILLNFWATWCAPCRKEMPALAALQSDMGGDDFEVVTVATGPNPAPAMVRFMAEAGIDNLPFNTDPRQAFAHSMGVMGLPVSVLIDRDGNELARLQGDADWNSDSARAIIAALIAAPDAEN